MMLVVGESRYMFYRNWKLAAMACSIIPVSNCALKVRCSRLTETDTVHEALADANSVAQEVISAMKTVFSFANEHQVPPFSPTHDPFLSSLCFSRLNPAGRCVMHLTAVCGRSSSGTTARSAMSGIDEGWGTAALQTQRQADHHQVASAAQCVLPTCRRARGTTAECTRCDERLHRHCISYIDTAYRVAGYHALSSLSLTHSLSHPLPRSFNLFFPSPLPFRTSSVPFRAESVGFQAALLIYGSVLVFDGSMKAQTLLAFMLYQGQLQVSSSYL
eukprot:1298032-Rhodomonas_salina.5